MEEFAQRLEESILELQQHQGNGGDASLFSASFCLNTSSPPSLSKQEPSTEPPWVPVRPEPPDWPGQIVPASVEKKQVVLIFLIDPRSKKGKRCSKGKREMRLREMVRRFRFRFRLREAARY